MKEEGKQPNSQNSALKKLIRKKWFYPAVYLTFAALILTAVIWYQNRAIDLPEDALTGNEDTEDVVNEGDNDSVPVVSQEEVLKMPVSNADDAEIVTKFYDYNASTEEQEQALILYNNKYYQSVGVDIASADGKSFDVTAALSGTVTEVKEDPIQGMVVELTHEDGLTTKYASLEEVSVKSGDTVTQGEVLGTAGQNLFGQANGVHLHFELRKDGVALDPEDFFNKQVSEIKKPDPAEAEDGDDNADGEDENANSEDEADDSTAEHDEMSRDEGNTEDEAGDDADEDDSADEESGNDADADAESSASTASA